MQLDTGSSSSNSENRHHLDIPAAAAAATAAATAADASGARTQPPDVPLSTPCWVVLVRVGPAGGREDSLGLEQAHDAAVAADASSGATAALQQLDFASSSKKWLESTSFAPS